ncbi:protein kinase [Candidatus Woesearchaeota archaeon]|jgi:serine/threonine protein kinase|nr:protein kinase [Candidatus Woesearchaeota archaeon]MBT6518571.1 protein kinase [Candidatus Woesearchaeota archaeon]MBT7366913.1 protein kinase [Candidatus Woesearchaeota archaeon]
MNTKQKLSKEQKEKILAKVEKARRAKLVDRLYVDGIFHLSSDVRSKTAESLGVLASINVRDYVDFFEFSIKSSNSSVQDNASKTLADLVHVDKNKFLKFYERFMFKRGSQSMAKTLSELAKVDPYKYFELCEEGMNHSSDMGRSFVAVALGDMAKLFPDKYIEIFEKNFGRDHVSGPLVSTLGNLAINDEKKYIEFYKLAMKNKSKFVRCSAAETLGSLASVNPEKYVMLYSLAINDKSDFVFTDAAKTLGSLAKADLNLYIKLFKECINNKKDRVRKGVALSLRSLCPVNYSAYVELFELGIDKGFSVASSVASTIDCLANAQSEDIYVEFLDKCLDHSEEEVKSSALRTVGKLINSNPQTYFKLLESGNYADFFNSDALGVFLIKLREKDPEIYSKLRSNLRQGVDWGDVLASISPKLFLEMYDSKYKIHSLNSKVKLSSLALTLTEENLTPIRDEAYKLFESYLESNFILTEDRTLKSEEAITKELKGLLSIEKLNYLRLTEVFRSSDVNSMNLFEIDDFSFPNARDLDEMVECAQRFIPNYSILSRESRGSSKIVYKAIYQKPGFDPVEVALKIVDRTGLPDSSNVDALVDRFGLEDLTRKEVSKLFKLNKKGIARLIDFGKLADGKLFITEEFIRGKTFREYLEKREEFKSLCDLLDQKRSSFFNKFVNAEIESFVNNNLTDFIMGMKQQLCLSKSDHQYLNQSIFKGNLVFSDSKVDNFKPKDRVCLLYLQLFRDLINNIEYIQDLGFIHLDIKPENVIINQDVYLTDLQTVIEKLRANDSVKGVHGSRNYAMPQLIEGGIPDFSADIYSLTVMLFEAITGELPYDKYSSDKQDSFHKERIEQWSEKSKLIHERFSSFKNIFNRMFGEGSFGTYYESINEFKQDFQQAFSSIFLSNNYLIGNTTMLEQDMRSINLLRKKYGARELREVLFETQDIPLTDDGYFDEMAGCETVDNTFDDEEFE